MKKLDRIFYIWLPPVIWMIVIFFFSTQHRLQASSIFTINFIFFKSLHVIEYATLYFLLFRAFYLAGRKKVTTSLYIAAAVIAILYASSDEFHQTFVLTREGTPRDVLIDCIGITLMFLFIKTHLVQFKKYIQ